MLLRGRIAGHLRWKPFATDNPPLSPIVPIAAKEIVLASIDRINPHDVEGLGALMSDDHIFIDAPGNQVSGREKMIVGWRAYFDWFPDYFIEITDAFEDPENSRCLVSPADHFKASKRKAGACPPRGRQSRKLAA